MKVLDLFSGIGGFSLGLERAGMETVAFCEIDKFCQKVLNKHWPNVPIFEDVRSLDYDGTVDVICGGFPCQPFSVAGKQKGKEDDRHLWPAMFSLIQKYRPNWVIGENVAGLVNMGLDDVLTDLESEGYTVRTFVIPACAINAPHRRDRVWIVGYSEHDGPLTSTERGEFNKTSNNHTQGQNKASQSTGASKSANNEAMADTLREGLQGFRGFDEIIEDARQKGFSRGGVGGSKEWSEIASRVCRDDDGVSNRMDRLKSLGNAVVPQIPEIIGRAIMEIDYPICTRSAK